MKHFFSLIIIILFSSYTNGQNGFSREFRMKSPFPITGNSRASMFQTVDSSYMAVYNVNDTASGTDLMLVKMNWNGIVLWEKKIVLPTYMETLLDAVQMPDSTINILCTYDNPAIIYDEEVYFVKIDLSGNLITTDFITSSGICCWDICDGRLNLSNNNKLLLTHRSFGISFSNGVVELIDTNYNYIYGAIDGTALYHATAFQDVDNNYLSFGHEPVTQQKRASLVKRNSGFTYQWQKFFRHSATNSTKLTIADDAIRVNSNYVLLMHFEDTNALNNIYIVKTNLNGDSISSARFMNESQPFGIYSLGADGYCIAASNYSNANNYWMELIRIDTSFNIIARQKYRYKNFNEACFSFKQSSDGYYLLAGSSDSVFTRNIHVLKVRPDLCVDPSPDFTVNYNTGFGAGQAGIIINNISDNGVYDTLNTTTTINFGDGPAVSFVGDTISHLYATQGTYIITITVTTPCGTKSISKPITVPCTGQPSAYTYTTNELTLNVAYNHVASNYDWDFGDTGTANTQTATHIYTSPGTYYICLNTTNTCGNITICDSIVVQCQTPVIPFASTAKGCNGTTILVDAGNANKGCVYLWSDGQTIQQAAFTIAGIYSVTVTNVCGESSSASVDVQFSALPLVDIGADSIMCLNDVVWMGNYASNNPYGFEWYIDNQLISTGSQLYFSQSSLGLYHVTLIANNNGCVDSASRNISVNPTLFCDTANYCIPIYTTGTSQGDYIKRVGIGTINNITGGTGQPAYMDYTNITTTLNAGQSVTLTLDFNEVNPMYYRIWIDYNQDGVFSSLETLTSNAVNSGVSTTFTSISTNAYGGPTRMRVRCANSTSTNIDPCASYAYGQTEDYTLIILNGNGAPITNFKADTTHIYINDVVNFTDLSYNTPTAWEWTFTGASTPSSTVKNPANIVYPLAGCYPVTLKATNPNGFDIKTDTCYIFVDLALGSQQIFSEDKFNVQPNPFTNSFTLNYSVKENAVAKIRDITGRVVKQVELSKNKFSIDVDMNGYSKGIYLLEVECYQQKIFMSKLVKVE
ncbi:MAG: PKD domain-containing protein [Bacteroidia bacterium]